MPTDKTRLGIRVDSRQSEYSKPPVHYVYHWDRIVGAVAVLLLAIGGVGYAGYLWLSPATESVAPHSLGMTPAAEQPSIQAEDGDVELAKDESFPATPGSGEPAPAMAEPSTPMVSEAGASASGAVPDAAPPIAVDAPKVVAPAANDAPEVAAPKTEAPFAAEPPDTIEASYATSPVAGTTPPENALDVTAPVTVAVSDAPEPVAEVIPEEPATPQDTATDPQPAQAPQHPPRRAMFGLRDVEVLSPAVQRFLLAKSVINNEPRGEIGSIVPKADGAAAVYCFSDIVGMKDKVLYYHWLRDGKRMAKVRVGAWGKRWRSHSSKILSPAMKGEWRVELRKADNTLLASAEFVYR